MRKPVAFYELQRGAEIRICCREEHTVAEATLPDVLARASVAASRATAMAADALRESLGIRGILRETPGLG